MVSTYAVGPKCTLVSQECRARSVIAPPLSKKAAAADVPPGVVRPRPPSCNACRGSPGARGTGLTAPAVAPLSPIIFANRDRLRRLKDPMPWCARPRGPQCRQGGERRRDQARRGVPPRAARCPADADRVLWIGRDRHRRRGRNLRSSPSHDRLLPPPKRRKMPRRTRFAIAPRSIASALTAVERLPFSAHIDWGTGAVLR
jgi:hypothetical protein